MADKYRLVSMVGNLAANQGGLLEIGSVNVKNTALAERLAFSLEANKNDLSCRSLRA